MRRLITPFVALLAMMAITFGASAQDAAPIAHPAHIHAGTCAELDPNPTYPLNDVTQVEDTAVFTSTIAIDATLDDLLASPFAINAHQSAEDITTYVACGDIVGPVVDGQLLVPMYQQSDSGITGIAVLATNDAGGTDVTVYLVAPAEPAA